MTSSQQSQSWDPSTIALTPNARTLVDDAVEAQFQARKERLEGIGKLARRNKDARAEQEWRTVAALILDPLAHHLSGAPEPLVIKLDNNWLSAGPADHVARNRTVIDRLYDLGTAEWLKVNRSAKLNNKFLSKLRPGPELLKAATRLGVDMGAVGAEQTPPEIELRGTKPKGVDSRRLVLPFKPNAQTQAIENQLSRLNERLYCATLSGEPYGSIRIDVRRRGVSRSFLDGSFERGGRLGGSAFWLNLRKDIRRAALRIDGEPIAEVDIQAAMPSIAYALEGVQPDGDPYTLDPPGDIPREAVKLALMQMLWRPVNRRTRLSKEARDMIPKTYVAGQVFDFIKERNQPIAQRLGAADPCGAELMWHESEIIIEATLRCFDSGFSALPLHDALLTSCSRAEEASAILSAAFADRFGIDPTIKVKSFVSQAQGEAVHA
mgnify:CR=1 FL=1